MMKKIAYDVVELDPLKIIEDSECCLKVNAVISKAGVYQYDDGMALKPKRELHEAASTARWAKLTLHNHPVSKMIMSRRQVYGEVQNPFFDRDKIRAVLSFDKQKVSHSLIHKIKETLQQKAGLDVSIGFYYEHDPTPGTANDVNTGELRRYDYVMRDIFIDHVAVMFGDGEVRGRCTFPSCGIGVDAMLRRLSVKLDKVVQRGEKWCVVHCHEDGSIGETIKCFSSKEEAESMHRAIQAQKHGASRLTEPYEAYFAKTDQDKRPPKTWWENCTSKAQNFASDPNRYCNWAWYEGGEELKSSFGGATTTPGGMKEKMSLEELYYPERSKEYNACVTQRMAEGMTRGEAEAHCAAATLPEEEPQPEGPAGVSEHTTAEAQIQELSPWQACIKEQMQAGMSQEEAAIKCKQSGLVKTDQDAAFENCVARKMEEGSSREEAEQACRAEHPVEAEDQLSDEETELQRCIKNRMEAEGESQEQAEEWCRAEKAGEHEAVDTLLANAKKLMKLKEQARIRRKREARRYPLR